MRIFGLIRPRLEKLFEISQHSGQENALKSRKVRLEIVRAGPEKFLGAQRVPLLEVDQGRGQLNQPLVKFSLRAFRLAPEIFENFVGLKKFFFFEKAEIFEVTPVVNYFQ